MLDWDDDQREVIETDPDARILVEAGPGTGKTAVACARVASLINDWEVQPANILLLSFTRTAVAEMRSRIASYVGDQHRAAAVKISTLDSAVWYLICGFDQKAADVFGGYEANILAILQRIEAGDSDLMDYLSRYQHIIVDEAQDLTSARAKLVIALIKALAPDCGVTIFADPHQAIYGFTNDADEREPDATITFLDLLRREGALKFRGMELKTLHRTNETALASLMSTLRCVVSTNSSPPADQHALLKNRLHSLAGPIEQNRTDLPKHADGRSDLLILYRRRAEVLLTSSLFCSAGITHRLRLSGLPSCLQPWLGRVFFDCRGARMSLTEFRTLWAERDCASLGGTSAEQDWAMLYRIASVDKDSIDIHRLRQVLARSRPPSELCVQDCVREGPILGTIHASKGREADTVYLFVSDETPEEAVEEESRVVYVGATRAKKKLHVAAPGPVYAKSLKGSGRAFWVRPDGRSAQVEIGRDGDLVPSSPVSKRLHAKQADAFAAQDMLATRANATTKVTAHTSAEYDWKYRVRYAEGVGGPWIGEFSEDVGRDLWAVIKITGHYMRPPLEMNHLFAVSTRTVVLDRDHPELSDLHFPYQLSGFLLAPVIRAWTIAYFKFRKGRR